MPPSILLMRHGETIWNLQKRMQGRLDSPLTWRGVQQARACAETIAASLPASTNRILMSSPLNRCWQTAAIVADRLGIDPAAIVHDPDLREISWGEWDGLTAEEITDRDAERWQAVIDSGFRQAPPDGDSIVQTYERAQAWLAAAPPHPIIIVSHGMFGRALRCAYASMPIEAMLEMGDDHASVFELADGAISQLS